MAGLLDLPRELRQQILGDVVNQNERRIGRTWPSDIRSLLLTCKLIQDDMHWALRSWHPTWYIQTPSDFSAHPSLSVNGELVKVQMDHMQIRLWHEVHLDKLKRMHYITGYPGLAQPGLMTAWFGSIKQMSLQTKILSLDLTPTPGWMLEGGLRATAIIIDERAARLFMREHVDRIIELVHFINHWSSHTIPINITGRLSHKSARFVQQIQHHCGVEFVGEYINGDQLPMPRLRRIINEIAPKHKTPENEIYWKEALRLAPLRKVRWSGRTEKLIGKACEDASPAFEELNEELRAMTHLMVSEEPGRVQFKPNCAVYRAMLHAMAEDMKINSSSEGQNQERHVVVSNYAWEDLQ